VAVAPFFLVGFLGFGADFFGAAVDFGFRRRQLSRASHRGANRRLTRQTPGFKVR
jgi:hypothetical protein